MILHLRTGSCGFGMKLFWTLKKILVKIFWTLNFELNLSGLKVFWTSKRNHFGLNEIMMGYQTEHVWASEPNTFELSKIFFGLLNETAFGFWTEFYVFSIQNPFCLPKRILLGFQTKFFWALGTKSFWASKRMLLGIRMELFSAPERNYFVLSRRILLGLRTEFFWAFEWNYFGFIKEFPRKILLRFRNKSFWASGSFWVFEWKYFGLPNRKLLGFRSEFFWAYENNLFGSLNGIIFCFRSEFFVLLIQNLILLSFQTGIFWTGGIIWPNKIILSFEKNSFELPYGTIFFTFFFCFWMNFFWAFKPNTFGPPIRIGLPKIFLFEHLTLFLCFQNLIILGVRMEFFWVTGCNHFVLRNQNIFFWTELFLAI